MEFEFEDELPPKNLMLQMADGRKLEYDGGNKGSKVETMTDKIGFKVPDYLLRVGDGEKFGFGEGRINERKRSSQFNEEKMALKNEQVAGTNQDVLINAFVDAEMIEMMNENGGQNDAKNSKRWVMPNLGRKKKVIENAFPSSLFIVSTVWI